MSRRSGWVSHAARLGVLGFLVGCSGGPSGVSGSGGGRGQGGTSGSSGSGGVRAGSGGLTGPASQSGGKSGTGGALAAGGATNGGAGIGGKIATGGRTAAGGAFGSGGARGNGGATRPVQSTGGSGEDGGTAGASGGCPGTCPIPESTSCSSPKVRITQVDLGATLSYSTDERWVVPLAIAAKPGGGSLIAWVTGYANYGSSTTSQVHVGELDCQDNLVGPPFTFAGHDFQDLAADGNGGVVVLTRDAQGSDAQHCGDVDNLCVLPNDRPGCYDTYMVRFDCAGTEQWATKLTSSSATNPPYSAGAGYNYAVWWYQHHGRLAYDGTNYAAYFCDAITVTNNACSAGAGKVDIHQGDRMKVVGPTGALLTGHDSFDLGCSHSWTTRIVWDPRTSHFVTVCATDNSCRIARAPDYKTIVTATCDNTLFGGDLINAATTGYWTAWSYQNVIRLEHFTTGASDQTVTAAATGKNPHLVAFGAQHMLLAWKSGASVAAQVYDAGTGAPVGEPLALAVPDHPWQSWKAFPDGSVAFATVGAAASTIQIARVLPCAD